MLIKNIEYEIVEHCNLRCKNCNKFSYIKEHNCIDIDQIKKDFFLLSKRFTLENFTILGGEPLLHPDLNNIILLAKKAFNNSAIKIITNGALFFKKNFIFLNLLSAKNITLEISKYELNIDYEKIKNICKKFNINFILTEKQYFKDFVDKSGSCDPDKSFKRCRELVYCPSFFNGKLFQCGYSKSSEFLTKTSRLSNFALDKGIDISSTDEQIYKYLTAPVPTCKFCSVDAEFHPWRQLSSQEIKNI